jgi:two-component system cell cycle sensor histidine kinase/response regulator CckA
MKVDADSPLRPHIDSILQGADRAASLSHGLLAFSRKQVINMGTVDLNKIIRRVQVFLERVIGEDIDLGVKLVDGDLNISADSGQIEQVLMNLTTNARDAMPHGGIISIGTVLVTLDKNFIKIHGYGEPGTYALLTVTDTGTGMDEPTKEKIFEPFFTTKEVGKGTGLGLSMAYGIIKQHNGYINVYSEPGHGTAFKIYLPAVDGPAEPKREPETTTSAIGGTETILLAEDDAVLRMLTEAVLTEFGYTVITAENGEDAVRKFMEHSDAIHLSDASFIA